MFGYSLCPNQYIFLPSGSPCDDQRVCGVCVSVVCVCVCGVCVCVCAIMKLKKLISLKFNQEKNVYFNHTVLDSLTHEQAKKVYVGSYISLNRVNPLGIGAIR